MGSNAPVSSSFTVVQISDQKPDMQLSLQACAGLINREKATVYMILKDERDFRWLKDLQLTGYKRMDAKDLLTKGLCKFPRCMVYSQSLHQALLPNILTYAAIHDAIPIEEGILDSVQTPSLEVLDARIIFLNHSTPVLATEYMFDTFSDRATALAMLNPGYSTWDCPTPWNPPLNSSMDTSFIDFVFKERLFVVYLVNSGLPFTVENRLMDRIAKDNPWTRPLRVYGYADFWHVFGGFIFEAYTRLTSSYNMGAIPTAGSANLSFFSMLRGSGIKPGQLEQNAKQNVAYQADKTYVAFVVGDGDNIAFMLDQRAEWIKERTEEGNVAPGQALPPLTWTISPHLAHLAPSILEWYYTKSRLSGSDYFMLPPSGHLYAYPSSMPDIVQDEFVKATEYDASLLGTEATINWEWFTSWPRSERDFLPKYGRKGMIRAVFPSNVPFPMPTFTWNNGQFFKVLRDGDNPVVLFRPREWRGVDGGRFSHYCLPPEKMAIELASYPLGTVAYVYMSSDEGLKLNNSFRRMLSVLPQHVQLVSAEMAGQLALHASSTTNRCATGTSRTNLLLFCLGTACLVVIISSSGSAIGSIFPPGESSC